MNQVQIKANYASQYQHLSLIFKRVV